MNYNIKTAFDSEKTSVIIPLLQDDQLSTHLKMVSEWTGIDDSVLAEDFTADLKSVKLVYGHQAIKRVYLVGLGKAPKFKDVLNTFRSFGFQHKKTLPTQLGIYLLHLEEGFEEAITNGLVLSSYDQGLHKTTANELHPLIQENNSTTFYSEQDIAASIERGIAIGKTQMKTYDLVNEPANFATPQHLAEWAIKSGEKHGYKVTAMEKAQIEELGLHALLAVNRGSELPPYFIVMEYTPEQVDDNTPTVGIVGKGITYDTGGLNIKVAGMYYMKCDMGGSAAVLGAMEATAKLKLPIKLIGIVPTTDNCVDAKSIRPSDIIQSYSGKTIEIIDTDAEGRLILADGLYYMKKHFNPDVMIDLATLTGSSVRAVGSHAATMFSHNDELAQQLYQAGQDCGERVWRMPLWDDYKSELNSDIADVKNLGTQPVAGAITAAKFLEHFVDEHPRWAHLDIAGVAFGNSEFGKQRHGTAYGVRLLVTLFEELAK